MLLSRLIVRRVRLGSGLILLLFVTGHLCNLALGLGSVDAIRPAFAAAPICGHDRGSAVGGYAVSVRQNPLSNIKNLVLFSI